MSGRPSSSKMVDPTLEAGSACLQRGGSRGDIASEASRRSPLPEQTGFIFEASRCTGCEACRVACGFENGLSLGQDWRQVLTFNAAGRPEIPRFHLSLACNHCAHPACADACPAVAYRKDAATGAVLIEEAACMGCRYCTWACPYDAPRFDATEGVMTKCTFCKPRLEAGLKPACATACPTGALDVARFAADPAPLKFPGLLDDGLAPALRLGPVPKAPLADTFEATDERPAPPPRKVNAAHEWPLVFFTTGCAALVSLETAAFLGTTLKLGALPFLVLGALLMGLSTLHLGKPLRAWRAILGLRTSWLSREVIAFGAFLGLGAGARLRPDLVPAALPLLAGLVLLVCIDRLYQVVERRPWHQPRSGETLPAALLLAAAWTGQPALWVPALVLRGLLLLKVRPLGLGLGHLGVMTFLLIVGGAATPWALLALELADRMRFYATLAIPSPAALIWREETR